jgi:hypothetical protein
MVEGYQECLDRPNRSVRTARAVRGKLASAILLLAVVTVVGLSQPASATIVADKAGSKPSNPALDVGGHPLISPGQVHLSCFQNGAKITEGGALGSFGAAPSHLAGSLSFAIPGTPGIGRIVPLGDGTTVCVVSPSSQSLRPVRK